MSRWVVRSNSDELTHYGILGMKWGVRRTAEELAKAGEYSFVDRNDTNFTVKIEKDKQGSYKINIDDPTESYGFSRATITTSKTGEINLSMHSKSKGSDVNMLVNDENYQQILNRMGYSEEDVEEMITDTVYNAMEENGIEYDKEKLKKDLKKLGETMNKYRKVKRKIEEGKSKVKSLLERIGNQIVKTVKDVGSAISSGINAAKDWVSSIFKRSELKHCYIEDAKRTALPIKSKWNVKEETK